MNVNRIDIPENDIYELDKKLLSLLLKDKSSGRNIIWATDNYLSLGKGYSNDDKITVKSITGRNCGIVKPRVKKSKQERQDRIREKAEVFTPAWLCNRQNNLIDNKWFDSKNMFNTELSKGWSVTETAVPFPSPSGKGWKDYVTSLRLEAACGEAPYIVSRYDTVSGDMIELSKRIGILDRKLRVVGENTKTEKTWFKWALEAYKSVYGYDWQGDNVLLARENLLATFIDYYAAKFLKFPKTYMLLEIAEILAWNIWQMDGIKYVIPNSCHKTEKQDITLCGIETKEQECLGCEKNDAFLHNGIYCKIRDWKAGKTIRFVSMIADER